MTLAIETHNGRPWLVHYASPTDASCVLVAEFANDAAVATYKAAVARKSVGVSCDD